MDIGTLANLATAIAVVVGIVFGILELGQRREERDDRERSRTGSPKSWEWFQWLAERLDERRGPLAAQKGAYQLHGHWQP